MMMIHAIRQLEARYGFELWVAKEGSRVIAVQQQENPDSEAVTDVFSGTAIDIREYQRLCPTFDGRLIFNLATQKLHWHTRPNIPSSCVDGLDWVKARFAPPMPPPPEAIIQPISPSTDKSKISPKSHKKVTTKDTNPKDAVGIRKWRQFSVLPMVVIWELGVALLEGARKYGRHNYRVAGVRASVYTDAAIGHIGSFWEGEDIDVESGLSHITKAMASLAVLRDAMINGKWVDDRPPRPDLEKFKADMQKAVDEIFERHPEAVDAYVEGDQHAK